MMVSLALSATLLGGGGAEGIRWESQWVVAQRKARAAGKPLMIDFWAEWCGWCHRLDRTTYVDPAVVKLSRDFVPLKVDTEGGRSQRAIALKYDVTTLPTILFLTPKGNVVLRLSTFQGPGQFPSTMTAASEAAARVMEWEETLRHDPSDPAALAAFGVHLFEQEAYRDAKDLLGRARRVDSRRPLLERKRTRMLLGAMEKTDERFAQAEGALKDALALPPLAEYDAKVLYVMGKLYAAWGKPVEARAALQAVLQKHPQHPIAAKARETLVSLEKK